MRRFTKPVLTVAIIAALYIIGAAMGWRDASARADAGPIVTIGAPLPLPVSGTVAATQSGPWNVGISGQPLQVSVNNSPTVNLAPGSSVLSRGLDDPGRVAFQANVLNKIDCGNFSPCVFNFGPVAAGHRIVVQHIAGLFTLNSGAQSVLVAVAPFNSPTLLTSFVTPAIQSATVANAAFDQPVLFYLDHSQVATLVATTINATNSATFFPGQQTIALTGYELDCNVAPCSPIAQQ